MIEMNSHVGDISTDPFMGYKKYFLPSSLYISHYSGLLDFYFLLLRLESIQNVHNSSSLLWSCQALLRRRRRRPVDTIRPLLPSRIFLPPMLIPLMFICHCTDDRQIASSMFALNFIIKDGTLKTSEAETNSADSPGKTPLKAAMP